MTKNVASIYFAEVKADRELYGGYYRIPAVPKGEKPVILSVEDKVQVWQMAEMFGRKLQRDLILGEEIANDIVAQWTASAMGNDLAMTQDCHPGIWIVRDTIPLLNDNGTPQTDGMGKHLHRPATDEEKAAMWEEDLAHAKIADANWAQSLIQKGDAMAQDPKQLPHIPKLCKLAAQHYGRDREWLHELKDSDVKTCQFCTSKISIGAVKCPKCSEIVDFAKYAQLEAQRKAAVDAATKKPLPPPIQAKTTEARA